MISSFRRRGLALAGACLICGGISGAALALDDTDFNYDTTEDLLTVCGATGEGSEAALLACRAFLEATVQYHDGVSDRKKMKRLICYPGTATVADAREAFVAWGAANAGNAELMKEMPVVGVVRALAAKYPCK